MKAPLLLSLAIAALAWRGWPASGGQPRETLARAMARELESALGHYRGLTTRGAWPMPALTTTLRPGDKTAGLPLLHAWLSAVGDMPDDVPSPPEPDVYAGALVEGIKRFQARHGLTPDGVIGPRTRTALQAPLTRRIGQIEFSLEQLDKLPALGSRPAVIVNIPTFRLWTWQPTAAPSREALDMRVIVGRARRTPTPQIAGEMREVVFRPDWRVPRSILLGELLPLIVNDPAYLARNDLEILERDGSRVEWSADAASALAQGALTLRQRPGPANVLGPAKFVFNNDRGVFMHGTNAPELFERDRRDFSHGCIRVADPVALAAWVLAGDSRWPRERITTAIAAADTERVLLDSSIDVLVVYLTAVVMPDGRVHFADDVYGLAPARENRPGAPAVSR